jgi:phosphonate transport system substrate-binding protein
MAILAIGALLALGTANATEAPKKSIRFGLTATVAREDLKLYDRWAVYLGNKIGRPVEFVRRRTSREAMEMLETGEYDFAWINSFAYVRYREAKFFGLMAVPVFEGQPLSRSYIVVHTNRSFHTIGDLQGRVFAYSEPDSGTGYMSPRQMLSELGRNPDGFFRHTFFTYSHIEAIEAVAEQVADGAAVDSYVWEFLNRREPRLTAKTKVIQRSETFGSPPLVYRTAMDTELRARMSEALLTMDTDAEGRALLMELALDRFITAPLNLYDNVRLNPDRR